MKVFFKVLSVLLIIWAAIDIILGALIIFGVDTIFEYAGQAGVSSATLGAASMILSVMGVIVVIVSILMLMTGINGMRDRMDKCMKYSMGFLIFSGIALVLAIIGDSNAGSAFLQFAFFGIYTFVGKYCMKNNSSVDDDFYY